MNTKVIDLEPKYLCMIKNILRDQLGDLGIKVYIFGSRVQGKTKKTSDIDLALDNNGNKVDYIDVICKLRETFEESDIKYSVDILDLNAITDDFKQNINHDFVEIVY
ncbi:MAG: nucleotidyltransferase domain-containing protein [Endomicrobium sp.]|jgi:type I restriction enzyme S subunit|nr:nucleotidyltransferase domain-containing protein [Endomicrobium sp.]